MGKNRTAENHARKMRAFTNPDGTVMSHHERRAQQRFAVAWHSGKPMKAPRHIYDVVTGRTSSALPNLSAPPYVHTEYHGGTVEHYAVPGQTLTVPIPVGVDYSGGVHEQGPPPGPEREQWKRDNFAKHYGMQGKAADLLASDPRNAEAHRQQEQYEADLKAKRSAAARKAAATRAARKAGLA